MYEVVYADPPWFYNARNGTNTKFGGGAGGHYPLMKTEEICALDVARICSPDAVLFLWATFPRLQEALQVIEAWGFTYKTVGFTWGKLNREGQPMLLPGFYTGSNAEVCLLATRGKVLHPVDKGVRSLVLTQGRQRHSAKPAEVRQGIERMYPDARKVELFSREQIPGWDCWGNEVPSTPSAPLVGWRSFEVPTGRSSMANSKSGKPAAKKPTSKQEKGKKGQKVRKATKAKGSKN